jgi:hypothetical protein
LQTSITQGLLAATTVVDISLKIRLVFACTDEVTRGVFMKTDDVVTLHPAYLPSRQELVAWIEQLKAGVSRLKTFKLVIEYDTYENFSHYHPENNKILQFQYRENAESKPPSIQENMDLRTQQSEADNHQFTYQVWPTAITACYEDLIYEAETSPIQEAAAARAAAAANIQAGLTPGNVAAGVANDANDADRTDGMADLDGMNGMDGAD